MYGDCGVLSIFNLLIMNKGIGSTKRITRRNKTQKEKRNRNREKEKDNKERDE